MSSCGSLSGTAVGVAKRPISVQPVHRPQIQAATAGIHARRRGLHQSIRQPVDGSSRPCQSYVYVADIGLLRGLIDKVVMPRSAWGAAGDVITTRARPKGRRAFALRSSADRPDLAGKRCAPVSNRTALPSLPRFNPRRRATSNALAPSFRLSPTMRASSARDHRRRRPRSGITPFSGCPPRRQGRVRLAFEFASTVWSDRSLMGALSRQAR
jgi:hypothetical protein